MSLSEEKALFAIGPIELMVVVVGAVVIIGPKKLPKAMKQLGRFFVHARRMTGDVRQSFDSVIRDAETEIRSEEVQKTRELIEQARSEVNDSLSDESKGVAEGGSSSESQMDPDHDQYGHHKDDPNFVKPEENTPSKYRDENAQAYQAPEVVAQKHSQTPQNSNEKKETGNQADPFDHIEHDDESTGQKT